MSSQLLLGYIVVIIVCTSCEQTGLISRLIVSIGVIV